jgi:hypothetical protein
MTNMQGEVIGAVLAIVLAIYVFWPENVFAAQREKPRLEFLLERQQQLAENLRDLNFDYSSGKYPREDYEVQRAQLESEAALLQVEIEQLRQAR